MRKKHIQGAIETSLDSLSTCLLIITEIRFDAMLCANLGNENYDAGHIKCSRGPQVRPPPDLDILASCDGMETKPSGAGLTSLAHKQNSL